LPCKSLPLAVKHHHFCQSKFSYTKGNGDGQKNFIICIVHNDKSNTKTLLLIYRDFQKKKGGTKGANLAQQESELGPGGVESNVGVFFQLSWKLELSILLSTGISS